MQLRSFVHFSSAAVAALAISVSSVLMAQTAPPSVSGAVGGPSAAPVVEPRTVDVNAAAKVIFIAGEVNIVDSSNRRISAKIGDTIKEGDSIITGTDGELHLAMEDGGLMAVRRNTKMRVVKFQARGDADDSSIVSLLQGGFRSVTGWIGKYNQQKYLVRTPNATIGIRGTDHETLVIPQGATQAEGEAGTYDKVFVGSSSISTAQGMIEVKPEQAGFASHLPKSMPRVLSGIPAFFRGSRNERLIDGKHAVIQARIAERREARRTEIRKRLDDAAKARQQARREHLKQRLEAPSKARDASEADKRAAPEKPN